MINTNELRQGNFVFLPKQGWIVEVRVIHLDYLLVKIDQPLVKSDFVDCELEDAEAILLTEEWLKSFGILNKLAWFDLYKNSIRDGSGRYDGYIILSEVAPKKSVHLKYVHQLQNLYFGATCKELQYSPISA